MRTAGMATSDDGPRAIGHNLARTPTREGRTERSSGRRRRYMAKMLIGGEIGEGRGGKSIEVRNPATAEVVDSIPRGTTADVDAAVEAARKALPAWSALP